MLHREHKPWFESASTRGSDGPSGFRIQVGDAPQVFCAPARRTGFGLRTTFRTGARPAAPSGLLQAEPATRVDRRHAFTQLEMQRGMVATAP